MFHTLDSWRRTTGGLVAAAAILFATRDASAQAAPPALAIEDCVRLALQVPARQSLARANLEAWAERERSAQAGLRPNVRAHANASYAPLSGYDPALTDGGDAGVRVGVEQPLYDGGRTRGEVHLARAGAGQARTDQAVADADLALEVRLAFVDHWALVQRTRVLERAVISLSAESETSERLVRGGAGLRSDALRLAAQLAAARAELAAARGEVRAAQTRLAVAMGVDPNALGAVEDTVRLAPLAADWNGAHAVDVLQAAQSTEVAQLETRARRADRAPRMALQGDAGTWSSVERWRRSGFDPGWGYQVGVSFEMPLWDGGALAGRRSAAEAEVRARQATEQVTRQRAQAIDQAERSARDAALERAAGMQQAEAWAAKAAELVHTRWAGGAASGIEVLEAHRARTEFALARIDAAAEAARAQARSLRAGGGTP